MTDFQRKKSKALAILRQPSIGMRAEHYQPPATQLMWRLGIKAPPPHFMPFGWVVVSTGIYFSIFFVMIRYLLSLAGIGHSPQWSEVLIFGALIGLGYASYYAYSRRKHRLPTWQSL